MMFGWIYSQLSSFLQYLAPALFSKKGTILFLGLDNAGKTTLLCRLKEGRMITASPTPMPTNESLKIGKLTFNTYDLGGHKQVRRIWRDYMPAANGIVFMLDAADKERFPEARHELQSLLSDPEIPNIPFAVLANKIDLGEAASLPEITYYFGLECTTNMGELSKEDLNERRALEVFPCSVLREEGYGVAFRWLAKYI